jgi:hypothetical protein
LEHSREQLGALLKNAWLKRSLLYTYELHRFEARLAEQHLVDVVKPAHFFP